jgi:alpha-D-ribose 1-methylphosphonate 5-triphosphate synthase subunit PhnH
MAALAANISGGFADPVFDAQAVFRALMDAMARPGSIFPVKAGALPPGPLSVTAGAVALALCDHETPVWIDVAQQGGATVKAWIEFHCGAPVTHQPNEAHFALVTSPATLIALDNFAQGRQDYPDRSATIVLQVDTLIDGPAMRLEGPGIETVSQFAPAPLPRHFAEQWKQNRQRFPRGVDIIFAAPGCVACMPRTARIVAAEG